MAHDDIKTRDFHTDTLGGLTGAHIGGLHQIHVVESFILHPSYDRFTVVCCCAHRNLGILYIVQRRFVFIRQSFCDLGKFAWKLSTPVPSLSESS